MPTDQTVATTKLLQYLNEAYGTERRLEVSLKAHAQMATRDSYKKRLKTHLRETQGHAKDVKARIRALGGKAEEVDLPVPEPAASAAAAVVSVANKAAAAAQGPLHALRGTGEAEKLLKNAKTEYASEAQEIALYTAIEALATAVHDTETARLAKRIRREEERMSSYLERLIPTLTKAVATEEIPAAERRAPRNGSRSNGSIRRARSSSSKKTTTRRRKTATR